MEYRQTLFSIFILRISQWHTASSLQNYKRTAPERQTTIRKPGPPTTKGLVRMIIYCSKTDKEVIGRRLFSVILVDTSSLSSIKPNELGLTW